MSGLSKWTLQFLVSGQCFVYISQQFCVRAAYHAQLIFPDMGLIIIL